MENLGSEFDSELIIGLVSAVGTENQRVIDLLKSRLAEAGYRTELVKVSSDVIPLLVEIPDSHGDTFLRIQNLMNAGNQARSLPGAGDGILANGVASVIAARRDKDEQNNSAPMPKTAFIVDSLKRPEEIAQLRLIYPSGFVSVGIHSDETRRRKFLVQDQGLSKDQASQLIERDRDETSDEHGQRVNDTFHLADFFVQLKDNADELRCDIRRIVELWFGNPFITPTFDEHAMFLAFSAALRSADLSRQVGAVVTRDAQVLATGANDCPKAGGGLYWPTRDAASGCIGDESLGRDYKRPEGDSNRDQQIRLMNEILERVKQADIDVDPERLMSVLEKTGIKDLTEYGRVVHAEMEALLCCARTGQPTTGTTLYCTTFPCHNCAKHIIAAGVERVVYVEPYPKSKAFEFHDDSIEKTEHSTNTGLKKVRFEAFVGIGPRRFFELFSMNLGATYKLQRKIRQTGRRKDWNISQAQLRIQMKPVSYLELEATACLLFFQVKACPAKDMNP
jgi:deoxycytidylate deaminase